MGRLSPRCKIARETKRLSIASLTSCFRKSDWSSNGWVGEKLTLKIGLIPNLFKEGGGGDQSAETDIAGVWFGLLLRDVLIIAGDKLKDRTRKFDRYQLDEEFESFKDSDADLIRELLNLAELIVQISTTYYVPSHSNGFIHIYFPIHIYQFTYLLPACSWCLPGPIYVPTRQHIPTHLTRSVRTHSMSLCRHARSHRPAIWISFNCRHFFSPKVRALLEKRLWKGDGTLSLLICKVNWAISQCIYICAAKKWCLSQENMPSCKNMPYCCPENMPPPCNKTRNTPCCSDNLQLALKWCFFPQRNMSPFVCFATSVQRGRKCNSWDVKSAASV